MVGFVYEFVVYNVVKELENDKIHSQNCGIDFAINSPGDCLIECDHHEFLPADGHC